MFEAVDSTCLVPFDGSFRVSRSPTLPAEAPGPREHRRRLERLVGELDELQRRLYASDRHAVLLLFQAMDAAGKDGTIRAVLSGVNPAGFQVCSFKQPSAEELDHDFLWRTAARLPERGRIGVFNRSYYEEVLVVRVHPELLGAQKLPGAVDPRGIWRERFDSIRSHELHLARNGYVILKFWLNVSREEQRRRFLSRIDEPRKNWKFSPGDVAERRLWKDYMRAYQEALNATSRPWAPWYAVPADDKPAMRLQVAQIVVDSLKRLRPAYPRVTKAQQAQFRKMRLLLQRERRSAR